MSNVVFVVDSGSDYELENALNMKHTVEVVPLNIHIGQDEYLDGVTISKDEFYEKMAASEVLPKTSQPSPQQFFDVFKKYIDKGKTILSLSISSELSGTFQSASIAKSMLTDEEQKNVTLIDTTSVSAVVLLLLKRADELLNDGTSLEDVVSWIEENKKKTKVYALLDTLENLKKGGRISAAQALIGGLLTIKPLVTIANGKVETLGKSRGRKRGLQQLSELFSNIDLFETDLLFVVHSFNTVEEAKEEVKHVIDESLFSNVYYYKLGSTIGTYAAAQTIGIALKEK
jgi:DegV family protein with EDD domain